MPLYPTFRQQRVFTTEYLNFIKRDLQQLILQGETQPTLTGMEELLYTCASDDHIFLENIQTSLTVFITSGFPSIVLLFLSFIQVIISLTKFTVTL